MIGLKVLELYYKNLHCKKTFGGGKKTSSAWKERLSANEKKNYGGDGQFYRWLTTSSGQYIYNHWVMSQSGK